MSLRSARREVAVARLADGPRVGSPAVRRRRGQAVCFKGKSPTGNAAVPSRRRPNRYGGLDEPRRSRVIVSLRPSFSRPLTSARFCSVGTLGHGAMTDRPKERESEFLRERAAKLREIAAEMPAHIKRPLLDVADQLERRANKFEDGRTPTGPAHPAAA